MAEELQHWQEVGWDGISFQVPVQWQATVIHNSYLFFENDGQPAFEIKWQKVSGRFTAQHILDKLQRSLHPSSSLLTQWTLPENVRDITRQYSATGFQCQHDQNKTVGLVLYCTACRQASLLQFHSAEKINDNGAIVSTVLKSFSDHGKKNYRTWAMYDLRAKLPEYFTLQSHEFLPGRYILTFANKKSTYSLYRFKPAALLLQKQGLEEFGSSLAGPAVPVKGFNHYTVTWKHQNSGLSRLYAKIKKQPAWTWLQLQHIPDHNVIIGIKGTGTTIMDTELTGKIVKNFTVTKAY